MPAVFGTTGRGEAVGLTAAVRVGRLGGVALANGGRVLSGRLLVGEPAACKKWVGLLLIAGLAVVVGAAGEPARAVQALAAMATRRNAKKNR